MELEVEAVVDVPGLVPEVALPSATIGRPAASARVPNPDTIAHAATTATTTSKAATTVSRMCFGQFNASPHIRITRFAVAGEDGSACTKDEATPLVAQIG
jgi:hypothetical protein